MTAVPPYSAAAFPGLVDQWLAESMQVVNWGGFEGHHQVTFAQNATLFSGASGTGKSTLLDAYIALMMDSNTPFNGASNDSVAGRARGAEQRSILSYMRGKTDASRETETGSLRDDVLRGSATATWSGIAMTWRNTAGDRFTAMRLFYAPATATAYTDIVKQLATIAGPLNLAQVAEFAAQKFPDQPMKLRFPGIIFARRYQDFAAALHARLGIGAGGDGTKALKLLARIQGGRQFVTVDGLYKDMVLERPATYAAADQAVDHFDQIKASHDIMATAERQVGVLQEIPGIHQAMTAALSEADLIDTFRISSPEGTVTPFLLWRCRSEAGLIRQETGVNRASRADRAKEEDEARLERRTLKARVSDLQEQQRLNGGDAIDAADRALEQLCEDLETARKERARFDALTEPIGRNPRTREEFDALHQDSSTFLAQYPDRKDKLRELRDKAVRDTVPLGEELRKLRRETESLEGRQGLIPHDLHAARLMAADAAGLTADALPFIAELIDLQPEFEEWRTAAELALGGFAVTMLVDQKLLPDLRRAVNTITMPRRLRFEGAPVHQDAPPHPVAETLPGRLVYRDSPFTGWLTRTLTAKFGYTCVDSAEELNSADLGLTVTGQTRQGRRGAHGGHGAPPVIGFSNAARLKQIAELIQKTGSQLDSLNRASSDYDSQGKALEKERDGHMHVTGTNWASIDVQSVEDAIKDQQDHRARLLADNDILQELKEREKKIQEDLDAADGRMWTAKGRKDELDKQYAQLTAEEEANSTLLRGLEADHASILTAEQDERLRTECEKTGQPWKLSEFRAAIPRIRHALSEQAARSRRDADNQSKFLTAAFQRFQDSWERPNLGTGPDSYDGYKEILDHLLSEGLHERRLKFSREVSDWTGIDLLGLHGAYEDSIDEIEARLDPVNKILEGLPFGPGGDRLRIELRRTESRDITQFRKELKQLSSDTTQSRGPQDTEARYARLEKFIDRIRADGKNTQRDYFIDVRRHIEVEAERRDLQRNLLSVYTSIGGKSGGESQELVAFIVGAALRYQLGDADLERPRYAPVVLDEGFVKSDAEFTGRAVHAWQALGFQLVIGAPLDKVTGIEPYMEELYQVTKNARKQSHIRHIHPVTKG
jgi:uncharacterized protein YPO0396